MAWSEPYCTWVDINNAYVVAVEDEDIVEQIIDDVTAEVEEVTQGIWAYDARLPAEARAFAQARDVQGRVLWLDAWLHRVDVVTNGDGVVVAAGDYEFWPDEAPYQAIVLKQASGIAWVSENPRDKEISVRGWWANSERVPGDLKRAVMRKVLYYYRTRQKGDNDSLPRWVDETIERYFTPFGWGYR